MSKEQGPEFEAKYIEVLKLGGSQTPQELMAHLGVDLKSEAFWRGGFSVMEGYLSEFERQWAALNE
jgi:oligoendopeptidase F